MLTMEREVRTSQLEQNAFASRDPCASLAHPLERQQDLLHVAAQHATRKDDYVMAVIEIVQVDCSTRACDYGG